MYRNKRISLCLPCRNEGKNLKEFAKRIPGLVDETIVISNKSTDNTIAVAKKLNLKVFEDNRVKGNIGYGFAHMTGIENSRGDIIAGADGDATYPVEHLQQIVDYFLDNKLDFLSCSRYPLQPNIHIPLKLRMGVWTLNQEVRLLYGLEIKDILSGMWLFRKEVKDQLALTMGDWNLSPQIKLNAAMHPKIKFDEYNIVQHQRLGQTHQKHFKTGLSHLTWILSNRFHSKAFNNIN